MSLKTRVWRLLGKYDRRLTLAEDRIELAVGACHQTLEVATELRAVAARLEAAVAEQGKTLGQAFESMRDERERRIGLGKEVMSLSGRVDTVERRGPSGAAE
jgi:hypothetical protein